MDNSQFDYSFHYNNWHSDTDESRDHDIRLAQGLFNNHAIWPASTGDRVLEVGCGMGRFLLMLRDAGYTSLRGIDIDQSQIEVAIKSGLEAHLADALDFLRQDGSCYDVIYAFDVLEHISKDKQLDFLRLLCDHLTEEGFIVLQTPNAMSPTEGYFRYIDFTHTISFTPPALGFLLHNANLHFFSIRPQHQESKEIQQLKLPWARLYRYEFGMNDFILTPNVIAVAFKNQQAFEKYCSQAPVINNSYPEKQEGLFSRFWRHVRTMRF